MSDGNADIEVAKLAFEREKHEFEKTWKRRTYVWTILSALLTAGITLTIAFFASGGSKTLNLAVGPVENCLISLKRTESLSQLPDQDIENLTRAVQVHVGNCESLLETLVSDLK